MTEQEARLAIVRFNLTYNGWGDSHGYPGQCPNPADTYLGRPCEYSCFTAGTLITTPDGLVPIEMLSAGDTVLDRDGAPRSIEAVSARPAEVLRLRAFGMSGTRVTAEHPYWARRRLPSSPNTRRFGEPEWIEAGALRRGDLIGFPVFDDGDEPMDPAVAYMIGRWLADGWLTIYGRSRQEPTRDLVHYAICCAPDEASDLEVAIKEAGLAGARGAGGYRTGATVKFGLPVSFGREHLQGFGAGAQGKRVAGRALRWNRDARTELLRGYLDGDGSERDGLVRATSVSRDLIYGMASIARSLGHAPAVYVSQRETTPIEGRIVRRCPETYEMHFVRSPRRSAWLREGSILWGYVRSVDEDGEADVYNMTVADSHTFIADGAAVHNCADGYTFACKHAGFRLPPFYPGIATGMAYVPWGLKFAQEHHATRPSWKSEPADAVFVLTGSGAQPGHVEMVEKLDGDQLYTFGWDSGPSNVDHFTGQGGCHRHVWHCPQGVGNPAIATTMDLAKVVDLGSSVPSKPAKPVAHKHPMLMLKSPWMGTPKGWPIIATVQEHLNGHGASPRLRPDGVYGERTDQQVRDFQGRKELRRDGVVGPNTYHALGID